MPPTPTPTSTKNGNGQHSGATNTGTDTYEIVDSRGKAILKETIDVPPLVIPKAAGNLGTASTTLPHIRGSMVADITREYAAAPGAAWLGAFLRSLTVPIDDITRDFGDDLYDRMLFDPQVQSATRTLKSLTIEGGISFKPAEDMKETNSSPYLFGSTNSNRPRQASEKSKEICDMFRRSMEGLEGIQSFDDWSFEMLDGCMFGNKVSEVVYGISERGKNKGMFEIRRLKTKARHSTAFVVDAWNNIQGIIVLVPGQVYPGFVEWVLTDPGKIPNILPKYKFAVFSFAPINGDPRGTSVLRAAYKPWLVKQQTIAEYVKYIARFASPSVWANTPEMSQLIPLLDQFGNVLLNSEGEPMLSNPESNLLKGLLELRNGAAMAVPFGTTISALEMSGNGEPFIKALTYYDQQITKAITQQTLATDEGEHQARAASSTHEDILMLLPVLTRKRFRRTVRRDIAEVWVKVNYGEEYLDLVPDIIIGETSDSAFASKAAAISQLAGGPFLDKSQYAAIDLDLGLPTRDSNWIQRQQEEELAQTKAEADAKTNAKKALTNVQ